MAAAKPVISEVPARGRQRLSIEVPVEAVRARTELPLDYAFAGTSWRGRLTVLVQPGLQLGASVDGRDLVLDRREQQVSLCENDSNLARCLWKGPDDLSAKVWLAVADGQLRLRIEVRDDVHRQSHNGSTLWQGDSVQLGIAPAEGDAFWELCLARRDDGNDVVAPYSRPAGRGPLAATMRSSPIAGGLRYEVVITLASLGLDGEGLARGLRFNLLANDDDEGLREGWLELAPGIGQAKTAVEFVPVVLKR